MNFNIFICHLIVLLKRIGFILLILTFNRFIFFFFNLSTFHPVNYTQLLKSFQYGIRFDFAAVFYLNSVFIILHLFCFSWTAKAIFQYILKGLFIFINSIIILFNIIDTIYFQYTGKRSGWELIDMLKTSDDTAEMVPGYILHYWYLVLILLTLVFILFRYYPKYKNFELHFFKSGKGRIWSLISALIVLSLGVIFARGLETKPIRIITANRYVTPSYIPLLLNTPFTIINTFNQHPEKVKPYFSADENVKYFTSLHHARNSEDFRRKNVVIIILESFGKEYVQAKAKNGGDFTPFLDSLQTVSLNCKNAYANAKRSIDALPAIIGGFPSLLQTSYIGSAYSINSIRGLPAILKEQGYTTSFYHGGSIGTMGFDMFCKAAGIDSYYGRETYNNEKDYDGAWGIWDEEFLQYMANNLEKNQMPFLSVVFTLTSHDPYPIPEKYSEKFFPGEPEILRTIAYTDYALKRFFETASAKSWFKNTLFVITPDHTSVVIDKNYRNNITNVAIPILYFCPGDSALKGVETKLTQQLDIMPTILDYLKYNKSYISYGKSLFEEGNRFSVSYSDINYQIIDSVNFMMFDGEKAVSNGYYNIVDSTSYAKIGVFPVGTTGYMDTVLKAYLNDYYFRLNNNLLADTIEINRYVKQKPSY